MTQQATTWSANPVTKVQAWLFGPCPAKRLALLRVLTGIYAVAYLLARAPYLIGFEGRAAHAFRPVGPVQLLSEPLPSGAVVALTLSSILLSVPFLLGFLHRLLAPLFFAALVFLLSYANSFGKILHTDNLFVLHVGALAFSRSADALALDARTKPPASDHGRYQWPVRLMCVVAVCAYFIAGYSKLRLGGTAFVEGDTLRNFIAYDNVRKLELGSIHSPLGAWVLPYPGAFTALAWFTLACELGAPFALVHRRIGAVWAVLMWGFHVGVLALMAIVFAYPLTVGLACFFPVEAILNWRPVKRLMERLGLRTDPAQRQAQFAAQGRTAMGSL